MAFRHDHNNVAGFKTDEAASRGASEAVRSGKVIDMQGSLRLRGKVAIPQPKNITYLMRKYDEDQPKSSEQKDEQERVIIKAVLKGDVAGFQILVRRYQKPVYNLMYRVTQDAMTAEDLTQDTFARVFEKLYLFKLRRRFFPWLYAIAVNICKDHLRRQGLRNGLFTEKSDEDQWPDPDGQDCSKKPDCVLEVDQIAQVLETFPIQYSEPMFLYYREGFTIREISGTLGITSSAAKTRIHRGRQKLMDILGGGHEKK